MKLVDPIRYVKLKASGLLPSPKGLALAIVRLLQQENYQTGELVRLVQSDPAISGELLKFSNAASFGRRPIVSLQEAVTTLGTSRVRVLVLAFSVLHEHRTGRCPQFNYEQFWSEALSAAISARALSPYAKVSAEENFTAGLLCNLGELALASVFPDSYGEVVAISDQGIHKRLALERSIFGNDHRELNATLLLEWGLPEMLVNSIYHCETPDEAGFQEGSRVHGLTLTLHVALAMAKVCVADEGTRWAMLPNLYAKASRLGISTEEMNSLADEITASWREWGELLKIQTHQIDSFADLLASSQPRESLSSESACPWPNHRTALLICPESAEISAIIHQLETNGYTVKFASNSMNGLALAMGEKPDLILIEMSAPEIDGAQFCMALRASPCGQTPYVVLIANQGNDDLLAQVLDNYADDFLRRPITDLVLQSKLRTILKILQLQNEIIKERNGLVNFAGEWAGANRRLTLVALTDPLTQLANRLHGKDYLSTEYAFARTNNLPLACLMIDIDHFKQVNDRDGHKAGDAVLVKLAKLLQANARSGDLVFRYGGEEFCIICPGATLEIACAVAERIRLNVVAQPFPFENKLIPVTVSIGVAIMMAIHTNEEALIHDADTALYSAKKAGRNRVMSCPAGGFT